MRKIEIVVIIIVVIASFFRFFTKERDDIYLASLGDKKVSVEGIIVDEPEDRPSGTRMLVRIGEKSLALTSVKTSLDLKYGDRIKVIGTIERPRIIVGEDGRSFDYPKYLAKSNIHFLFKGDSIEIVNEHQANGVKEKLLVLKAEFINRISISLPEPYSLLASGLVVAGKGALSDDLQEDFQRVGLIHIVVLSGSNVTIIAEAIIKSLSFLPKFIAAAGGVFGIASFTVIAGMSATVVRSAVMSIIAIVGNAFGKKTQALKALVIAALGMILLNPDIVLYDPSFQLSFTGTLGLILLGETTKGWFHWVPEFGGLREIISAAVASQIAITPMILHMSGMVSYVSLLVNILVLPLLPLTMLMVFLTGCLGFIGQLAALPFAIVSYSLLRYELWIVNIFSEFNFAAKTISALSWLTVFEIYISYLLIFVAYRVYKKTRPVRSEISVKPDLKEE